MAISLLSLQPQLAQAAAPADTSEAQDLYAQGKKHYEIGEYERALELWKEAYATLGDSADLQEVRHTLVYNILEADIRVYEVNKDITYLRRAKTLLESYLNKHKQLYEDTPKALEEREATAARLVEVEEMLKAAETEQAGGPASTGVAPEEAKGGKPDLTKAKLARMREIRADPALTKQNKRYGAFIIGGSVGTGVGATVLIVGANRTPGTEVMTTNPDGTVSTEVIEGNSGYVLMGVGAIALAAGITFLVIGTKRRKKLRTPRLESSFFPYATPQQAGMGASFSF